MSRFEYLDLAASSSAIGKISSTNPLVLVASAKDLLALAAQLQAALNEKDHEMKVNAKSWKESKLEFEAGNLEWKGKRAVQRMRVKLEIAEDKVKGFEDEVVRLRLANKVLTLQLKAPVDEQELLKTV